MSQPDQLPVDPGNQLLGETPAQLATTLLDTPAGQRLALTIRTASTTLTVLLGAADAAVWGGNVKAAAGQMSSTGLIVANGHGPAAIPVTPRRTG